MFDRLPTPYGLVRLGVAPDHQKIKFVTTAFDKVAASPRFRFYGGVDFGKDVTLADLRPHYHQIVYCTGAQTDRRMGIPGEDLTAAIRRRSSSPGTTATPTIGTACSISRRSAWPSSASATWRSTSCASCAERRRSWRRPTSPTTRSRRCARAACREVYLLGRRGPAQAAFTNPEIRELGELADADITALPEEVELDPLSRAAVERSQDRATLKKVEILQELRATRARRQVAPAHPAIPRLAGRADRRRRRPRRRDAAGAQRARLPRRRAALQPRADRPLRGASGRSRVPLGRLPRRAAARACRSTRAGASS